MKKNIGKPNIILNYISNRLRWLGHNWRIPENNPTRILTFRNPMGSCA